MAKRKPMGDAEEMLTLILDLWQSGGAPALGRLADEMEASSEGVISRRFAQAIRKLAMRRMPNARERKALVAKARASDLRLAQVAG